MNDLPRDQLREKLQSLPEVIAVYAFGSFARGQVAPESDIDLAFVVRDRKNADADAMYRAIRNIRFPSDLDMVVVDRASSPLLLFEIIRGECLFARSDAGVTSFEGDALRGYYDNAHMRNIYHQYLREKFPGHHANQ